MDTNVVTPEGYEKLRKELNFLWRDERPKITKIVTWAAGLGDRSDNPDYQYNKKKLREIDRRVRFLRKRLEALRIIEYNPVQEGKAFFGAWVTLIDEGDETLMFRIVGPDEIYERTDYASVNAPIARACLGKTIGDEVVVKTTEVTKEWEISAVKYNLIEAP
jgi:transcription elongation factor GreB